MSTLKKKKSVIPFGKYTFTLYFYTRIARAWFGGRTRLYYSFATESSKPTEKYWPYLGTRIVYDEQRIMYTILLMIHTRGGGVGRNSIEEKNKENYTNTLCVFSLARRKN